MKACLLLFFYFSLIGQLHGADVKIKENESVMGSTAMTYDLSEEKLMKLKYKSHMVIQRHHFDYINITALLKIILINNCDSWKDQHLRGMLQRSLIMGSFYQIQIQHYQNIII